MSEPPFQPSQPPYQAPLWTAPQPAAPPPSTKKRKTWLIVVVVATIGLLLLIGGCLAITGSAIIAADEALSETSASVEPEGSPSSPEPTTGSSDKPDGDTGPAKIGQTFSYEDGLKVSVIRLRRTPLVSTRSRAAPATPQPSSLSRSPTAPRRSSRLMMCW
jgi:hypothetical protein